MTESLTDFPCCIIQIEVTDDSNGSQEPKEVIKEGCSLGILNDPPSIDPMTPRQDHFQST